METEKLIQTIIQYAYQVRLCLAAGFLESIYKNALVIKLRENGLIPIETEMPLNVYYKDIIVGNFQADTISRNQVSSASCPYL